MFLALDAVSASAPALQHKLRAQLLLCPIMAVDAIIVGLQVCASLSLC